jgi:hypothetical protein
VYNNIYTHGVFSGALTPPERHIYIYIYMTRKMMWKRGKPPHRDVVVTVLCGKAMYERQISPGMHQSSTYPQTLNGAWLIVAERCFLNTAGFPLLFSITQTERRLDPTLKRRDKIYNNDAIGYGSRRDVGKRGPRARVEAHMSQVRLLSSIR